MADHVNANAVNVAVVDGKTITQTVELSTVKNGQPIRIKAVQGGHYILGEGEKGIAPENITIKRVGKDLHVALEGSDPDQPQLIIEDFEGSGGQLVGIAEDGSYYPYISSDAEQDRSAAFLIEGVDAPQVLGSQELAGFGNGLVAGSGIGWFWPALLGLGALGLLGGIYAVTRDDDKDNNHSVITPNTPAVGGANDNVGADQGPITKGGSTDDTSPTFTGTGTPGNTIIIKDNGKPIGEAIVGDDGKWTFTPPAPLPEGEHSIIVVEKDKDGNVSKPSDEFDFIVDITAPGKSSIDAVTDDFGPQHGPVAQNGLTDDNTPILSGKGEAGAKLEIFANGVKIGETTVNPDGTWSYTPSPALADGTYAFTTVATDAAGNVGLPSDPYTIIVDTDGPGKPGIGTGGIEEAIDNVGTIIGDIGNGGVTDDGTPTFSGGGLNPGDRVTIIDNGVPIGEVIVGDDGRWEFTPDPALADGPHPITVIVTDPAGNASEPSDPYIIIVETLAPTIDEIRDDVGDIQDPLLDGSTTDDTTPTLVGSGVAGDIIIIRNNGLEIGREIVQPDGTWSFTPNPPLNNGTTNEFDVISQDPAGNQSAPSDPWTITIDTDAPNTSAVIESMGKDSGADSGDFVTNDGSGGRLIQGSLTAALVAGEKVQISTNGGATWLDVLLNADNTWNFLDQSSHTGNWTIQARVVDAAGNANTVSQTVTMDTTAPDAPLSVTRNGDTITVAFNSAGLEVGDIVNVVIDDVRVDRVLTELDITNGNISFDTTASPAANIHASIADQAGNISDYVSNSSGRFLLEDFSSIPSQPIVGSVDLGLFTARQLSGTASIDARTDYSDPSGERPSGNALYLNLFPLEAASVALDLNSGVKANSVSFNIYGTDDVDNQVIFFDELGVEVHREPLSAGGPGGVNSGGGLFEIDMPPGVTFSSMQFFTARGDSWVVDNFAFGISEIGAFDPREQVIEGGSDVYYGGDIDNIFSVADINDLAGISAGIKAGAGTDTLMLTGADQTLDLSAIAGKLESIEIIDITGTGNNTLNLSLGDVLEQGEFSLFTEDETVQMIVKGNTGDVVNLDDLLADGTDPGDWADQGQVTVEGVTYNVFQHSNLDAQLLVQDGVTTNLV